MQLKAISFKNNLASDRKKSDFLCESTESKNGLLKVTVVGQTIGWNNFSILSFNLFINV